MGRMPQTAVCRNRHNFDSQRVILADNRNMLVAKGQTEAGLRGQHREHTNTSNNSSTHPRLKTQANHETS